MRSMGARLGVLAAVIAAAVALFIVLNGGSDDDGDGGGPTGPQVLTVNDGHRWAASGP